MATQLTVAQPCAVRFSAEVRDNKGSNNVRQDNPGTAPELLQLPNEILHIIANFVGSSQIAAKGAKNLMMFGRVCVRTHLTIHLPSCAFIINRAKTKWQDDPNDPFTLNLVDGNGTIVSSRPKKHFFM